jgi:hypothetical protein
MVDSTVGHRDFPKSGRDLLGRVLPDSPIDLTTGLPGSETPGVAEDDPEYFEKFTAAIMGAGHPVAP